MPRFCRSFRSLRAAYGALLLLIPFATAASAQIMSEGSLPLKGPIPTRNAEPLNTPFLLPVPADASVLAPGDGRFDIHLDIANHLLTLAEPAGAVPARTYVTDFEEQRLNLSYTRGLAGGQEVSLRVPFIARNGGILDGFINFWHGIVKKEGGGRGDLPNYRVLFLVSDDAGRSLIDERRSGAGIGDAVIEYRRALTFPLTDEASSRRIAASVRALLKLPTGSHTRLFGSGGTDIGAGLALSARPQRRLALHGNATLVFIGDPRAANLAPRRTLVHWVVAVEYLINSRTSLLLQTDDNPAPVRSGFSFADQTRRGFTIGLWHQLNERNRAYLSLSENQYGALAKLAPDFTLSLGLRRGL